MKAPLTLDQLSRLLDMFEDNVRLTFGEDGRIDPSSAIGATRFPDGSRGIGILSVPWKDVPLEKEELQEMLLEFVKLSEAEWIINISECWAVEVKPGEDTDTPEWKRPAEREDRFELLILRAECPSGVVQRSMMIDRKDGEAFLSSTRESRMDRAEASAVADASTFAGYFCKPPTVTA